MDELLKAELEQLKKFFIEEKWVQGLFEVLFLIENAKPGVYFGEFGVRKIRRLLQEIYFLGSVCM